MADDYSGPNIVRTHGFLGAQISRYEGWTGRFSFTFVDTALALLGPTTPRFVPAFLLPLWLAGLTWAIYELQSLSGKKSWSRAALFAGFIIFATLETAPNVSQSLFWQTGALTYVAPLIPLSVFVALISRGVSGRHNRSFYIFSITSAGILAFIAGGFSDAYVVLQSCALILVLLASEMFANAEFKPRIRPFLIVVLTSSLLALTIVALAPGNSIRQAYFPKQFAGWDIVAGTVWYSFALVARLVVTNPLVIFASLLFPLFSVLLDFDDSAKLVRDGRMYLRLLLIIPAAVLVLLMCCTATSIYAISVMLPERARILLSFVFICGVVLWAWIAGEYLARKLHTPSSNVRQNILLAATMVLTLLLFSPLISFYSVLEMRDEARGFAQDWDRQDSLLKTAKENGVTDLAVPQIGDFQSRIEKGPSDLHLRPDPAFWINQRTATYYGLRSVRAIGDVAISR
jgi:hypothetical protein